LIAAAWSGLKPVPENRLRRAIPSSSIELMHKLLLHTATAACAPAAHFEWSPLST
jgi:hypothetical protein